MAKKPKVVKREAKPATVVTGKASKKVKQVAAPVEKDEYLDLIMEKPKMMNKKLFKSAARNPTPKEYFEGGEEELLTSEPPKQPKSVEKKLTTKKTKAEPEPRPRNERYQRIAIGLVGYRAGIHDLLRAHIMGKDVGLPLTSDHGHPMPREIIEALDGLLYGAIDNLTDAIAILNEFWDEDYPKAEKPREVTNEFKT